MVKLNQTFCVGYSDEGYETVSEWKVIPRVLNSDFVIPLNTIPCTSSDQWYLFNIVTLDLLENEFDIMSIGKAIVAFAEKFKGHNLWIKVETVMGIDVYFKARPIGFQYEPNYRTNTNFHIKLQMISAPVRERRGEKDEQTTESPTTTQE